MANIVILNSKAHARLRIHAAPSLQLGDNQRFVPVVLAEFPLLAAHYPIFLSKDADTGVFYCGVMLGFDAGENLFFSEHRAKSIYRPLNLQRGPFYTAGSDLAIDLADPRVAATGEQALFDEHGQASPYLQSIMALMQDLKPGQERTKVFIDTLLGLKLIEAINLDARLDDGSQRDVSGLYTVDRQVLKELPDESVVSLFRRGYLQLIYHMLGSLNHVPALVQRKNQSFLTPGASGAS